jgi:hypothetical protein
MENAPSLSAGQHARGADRHRLRCGVFDLAESVPERVVPQSDSKLDTQSETSNRQTETHFSFKTRKLLKTLFQNFDFLQNPDISS